MRILVCLFSVLFVTTSSKSLANDLQVLVTQFPPFVDVKAEDGGFAWYTLSEFASERGVEVTPVFRPTNRIFTQVENDDWQASLVAIPISENVAVVEYSDSEVTYGVFTSNPSLDSLNNLRIATLRTNLRSGFQQHLESLGATTIEIDSLSQGYRMMEAGRVGGVLGVGVNGNAIGSPYPEKPHMVLPLAVLPFTIFLNMNTPEGREAFRLLTD